MNTSIKYPPFEEIEINKTEIPEAALNIENRTRKNLFSWNGQFSPLFVKALLDKYAKPDQSVLDPFSGSGTVLVESARKNLAATGVELNPSAFYMSKTYEFCNLRSEEREKTLSILEETILQSGDERLLDNLKKLLLTQNELLKTAVSCHIILMDLYNFEPTKERATLVFQKLHEIISELPYSNKKISAICGDVRTELYDCENKFDIVLTSPPYINVFNYHQNYRKSVEFLGYDVLKIARKEFGSNRRNRGNRLLTVIEYCIDMALSISAILNKTNNDGRIIFVVGRTSTVLGYQFSNSAIIYDIFSKGVGLHR